MGGGMIYYHKSFTKKNKLTKTITTKDEEE
jgi:hypothetical protein